MSERNYKINETTKIVYQAPNKETGLTITAEIVLPSGAKDSNFPDITLTDVLSKGVYTGDFTPDEAGDWQVIVHKPGDEGQVVKRYSVGSHNVHDVGEAISGVQTTSDSIETKVDSLTTSVGALDTPPMIS